MFIEKLSQVRYQLAGYYAMCLSPLMSIILLVTSGYYVNLPHQDFLVPIMWHTGINVFIIGVQVSGITLYLVGYRIGELEDFRSLPFSAIVLTVWGLLVSVAVFFSYSEFMEWITQPFRRGITIWDNMEYAAGALKGLLWIVSGLTLIVTDLHPRK